MRVGDSIRRSILNKCAKNRRFIDGFIRVIWCECKEGQPCKSKSWEDWCDIELESYGSGFGGVPDPELARSGKNYGGAYDAYCNFTTPRKVFSRRELDAIQAFIDTHTFRTITQAKREIADDLLNDCNTLGLNTVLETVGEYGTDLSRLSK